MTGVEAAGAGLRPYWLQCPDCGVRTVHPDDIAASYCPRCRWWTSDPELGPARRLMRPDLMMEARRFRDQRRTRAMQLQLYREGKFTLHELIELGRHLDD